MKFDTFRSSKNIAIRYPRGVQNKRIAVTMFSHIGHFLAKNTTLQFDSSQKRLKQ